MQQLHGCCFFGYCLEQAVDVQQRHKWLKLLTEARANSALRELISTSELDLGHSFALFTCLV
jgi:hypothetical protein